MKTRTRDQKRTGSKTDPSMLKLRVMAIMRETVERKLIGAGCFDGDLNE